MSNSLSASENSSPSNSVRSFGAFCDSNHVPSTTPQAKPTAITGPALALRDRADEILQSTADSLHHPNGNPYILGSNGVLDDYEGSDPNTPRLPPTKLGNLDFESIPQEATVSLNFSDQLPPVSVSSQPEFSKHPYPSLGVAASIFPSSLSEPGTQILDQPTERDQGAAASLYSQDILHIRTWLERSEKAYSHCPTNENIPLPYTTPTKSHEITNNSRMARTWVQERIQTSVGHDCERPMAMGAREEAFSEEKRNRSSSRSSQNRVEKKIEATMADAEPSSHPRSRKSSHVLGLFKENKSSHDIKTGQEKQRTIPDTSIAAYPSGTSVQADETFRSVHEAQSALGDAHDRDEALGIVEEPLPMRPTHEQRHSQPNKQSQLHQQFPRISSTARSSSTDGLTKSRSDTNLNVDNLRPSIAKGQEKSEGVSQHNIPPRLLQEIRDYHNLTTPFHDKFRSTQPRSTDIDIVSQGREITHRYRKTQMPRNEGPDVVNIPKVAEDPENEEEEAEHISSALYYPHQAPSPDALEDISIDNARKRKDVQLETQPDLPDPALPITYEDEKAEDVDIALQVHNKNRYLHGDLPKARPSSAEPNVDVYSEPGFSSASDSEYEFLDETKTSSSLEDSSLTDDAEATPRASPKTRQSYLLSRSRKTHRGPKAPLGAVELKPYNHQVGGHTTVFRFSKRAVCKQLTNRENEFYEVIERQHPDLLRFLPRYVLFDSHPIRANSKDKKTWDCCAFFSQNRTDLIC